MTRDQIKKFAADVQQELKALEEVGLPVPKGAFDTARDLDAMAEYSNMTVGECADLLIDLAALK